MEVILRNNSVIEASHNGDNDSVYWRYDGDKGDEHPYCDPVNNNNIDGEKDNDEKLTTATRSRSKIIAGNGTQGFFYQPSSDNAQQTDRSKLIKSIEKAPISDDCEETRDRIKPIRREADIYSLEDEGFFFQKEQPSTLEGTQRQPIKERYQVSREQNEPIADKNIDDEEDESRKRKRSPAVNGHCLVFPNSESQHSQATPHKFHAKFRDIEANIFHAKIVDIDIDETQQQKDVCVINKANAVEHNMMASDNQHIKQIRGLVNETNKTEKNLCQNHGGYGACSKDIFPDDKKTEGENHEEFAQPNANHGQDAVSDKVNETQCGDNGDSLNRYESPANVILTNSSTQVFTSSANETTSLDHSLDLSSQEGTTTTTTSLGAEALNNSPKIILTDNTEDYKRLQKVTVIHSYIEPKKNIQESLLFSDQNNKKHFYHHHRGDEGSSVVLKKYSRRRSLSEGDLDFLVGPNTPKIVESLLKVDSVFRETRIHSRSCGDVSLYDEAYYESEEEDTDREEGEGSFDEDSTDSEDDIIPYNSDPEDFETSTTDIVKPSDSPRVRLARKRVCKKPSFIGKSVSVDLVPQNDRYFSNIRNRRNGLVNPANDQFDEGDDDFVTDLIEFKKVYKKPKKGLRIAKSVESFFDKSNTNQGDSGASSSSNKSKNKKRFLSGLFTKNEKMEYLRETSILDDDDCEVSEINGGGLRPQISIVEDSIQKVAGVIELYIDSHGDVIRKIEIAKITGQSLGFFIRFGNGIDRKDGIFISRVTLGSFVDENNLLHSGDEILQVNKVDVTGSSLEEVASMMQTTEKLIIKTRSALPLPMNTSPLLRSYSQTKSTYLHTDSSFLQKLASDDKNSASSGMHRTLSDPNQLNESGDDNDLLKTDSPLRERSRSVADRQGMINMPEKKFTRGQMYQSAGNRSPIYNRKLPSIPDGKIQDLNEDTNNSNKNFSRAQKYQFRRSPTHEAPEKDSGSLLSVSPKRSHGRKSPRMFRRHEHKKSGDSSMMSIPSNESLSSTSDSEESLKSASIERLHVYQSDSTTNSNTPKSFTGKLVVSIYKLIGRLSGVDGECYCTIEIDGEYKATTQLKRIKELVNIDESFEIDIQKASTLMFYIFHKHSKKQHKLVSQACIQLQNLLSGESTLKKKLLLSTTSHVQIRIKINFTAAESYLQRSPSLRQNGVFGFNLSKTLAKEENTIPIIVRKCLEEIEKRGLTLTGIYRISGNARKKKQLRAKFEEHSLSVDVTNEEEVDCHVLAGILKDYLRELPNPLISNDMYHNIYNKACVKNKDQNNLLAELMKELPYTNRATLIYIMDHLKRVAALSDVNKMTNQNLAVCFGPVMMSSPIATADMLDFKKQIDALEFLLNIWPTNVEHQNGI